jgi:aryl-phospho-beta-D-glucosidase BglC (GH1 family)
VPILFHLRGIGFCRGGTRSNRARWALLTVMTAALAAVMLPAATTIGSATAGASPESPNLLVGDHGSFDLSTGGWVGANASLARVSSPTQAGTGALAMTASTAGTAGAISGNGPTTWTPASPGQVYTGSAWAEAASTGRSVNAVLGFISSAGTATNAVWGQPTSDTTTGWTRTAPVVGIAPPGTAYVELVVYDYGAGQGETHYVDTASLTTHTVTSNAVTGPLHTSGNTIYDGTNAPLRLRGTNMEWIDVYPTIAPGSALDDNSVAHMKQWGINIVRVPLSEDFWTPNDCHYSPEYVATVDQAVQSITSRGMVALLDLHHNTRQPGTCAPTVQQRMADSPQSVNFLASLAGRYQSNPLVAFDLYNEPHDLTWSQWLNGGSLTDSDGVTWQAAGMQQLYDAVRGSGARNLVFVSGNNWATSPPPGTALVAGYNIVYAAHYYTCPGIQTPPGCTTSDPYNPAPPGQRLDAWSPLATTQPMMATEFGWPDPGNGTYTQNAINWAEARGIGWTAFEWGYGSAGSNAAFGFLADQSVFEPAASGMPVLAGLAGPVSSASPVPNCTTFYSPATGSHQVCGAIRDKYLALGGPTSFLGFPTTDTTGTPDGIGQFNHFANNGSIYWTASTGAWSIHGAIRAKWASMGWEQSILGYPTTDETGTSDGVGRYNDFSRGGSMYWTSSTGAWSVHGGIRDKYLALGGPASFLGYPITDETGTPDGVGRFNHFSSADGYGASIYWTPGTGAWSIHGAIRTKWASMGWERSCLGYPVSDEFAIPNGRESNLQRGVITYSFGSGQTTSSC